MGAPGFKKYLKNFALFAIIFEVVVAPVTPIDRALAQAPESGSSLSASLAPALKSELNDPQVKEAVQTIEHITNAMETDSDPNAAPPADGGSQFLMGRQSLEVQEKDGTVSASYNLSDVNVSLPPVSFELSQIVLDVSRTEHRFSLGTQGPDGKTFKHSIYGVDVIAAARNGEIAVLLDSSGWLYSIDLGYFKTAGFQNPVPAVEVARVFEGKELRPLRLRFVTRGLKPYEIDALKANAEAIFPQDVDLTDPRFTAGDLMIEDAATGSPLGLLDYGKIMDNLGMGTISVAMNAISAAPGAVSSEVRKYTFSTAYGLRDRTGLEFKNSSNIFSDPMALRLLATFSEENIKSLTARTGDLNLHSMSQRDRFTLSEWQKDFPALAEEARQMIAKNSQQSNWRQKDMSKLQAQLEDEDLGPSWREIQTSIVNHARKTQRSFYRAMSPRRMRMLGMMASGGAAALAAAHWAGGMGALWSLLLTSAMHRATVLSDASYRWLLMKSVAVQCSLVLIPITVGMLYEGGLNFKRGIATFAARFYAYLQLPFIHLITKLGQPHFMNAISAGINPFKSIDPESPLGQELGLTEKMPVGVTFNGDQIDKQQKALTALVRQRAQAQQLAGLLSNIIVSQKYKVDLPTLLAFQKGMTDQKDMDKFVDSDQFAQEQAELADETTHMILLQTAAGTGLNVSKLAPEEIIKYYAVAREAAAKIQKLQARHPLLVRYRQRTRQIRLQAMRTLGKFGLGDYLFLRGETPSQFVQDQFLMEAYINYYLGTFQVPLWGDRANLSDPGHLVAQQNGVLWTNRQYLSDQFDTIRSNFVNSPATKTIYYDKQARVEEKRNQPIETITQQSIANPENYMRGMRSWIKGTLNVRDNRLGQTIIASNVIKRITTLQATILLFLPFRLMMGHQPLHAALAGFVFSSLWGFFSYSFPWPIMQVGNKYYRAQIEALSERLESAKVKLSQGLRLDDQASLNEGFDELMALYREHEAPLPESIERAMGVSRSALGLNQKSLDTSEMREYGQALLDFSIHSPPIRNAPNHKILLTTTTAVVIITNLLGVSFNIAAFGTHFPLWSLFQKAVAGYSAIWLGQKAIDRYTPRVQDWMYKKTRADLTTLNLSFPADHNPCADLLSAVDMPR